MFLIDLVNDYNHGFHLNSVFTLYKNFEYSQIHQFPTFSMCSREKKKKNITASGGLVQKCFIFFSECVKSHDLR